MKTLAKSANVAKATSTEDLGFWSQVFTESRIGELDHTLKFADFLRAPWQHLKRLGADDAPECVVAGFLPLLPTQRAVRDRLDSANVFPIR